jgi:hypothetical protein
LSASGRWSSFCGRPGRRRQSEGARVAPRNSRDFAPLAREWAEARRSHAGLILIWTLDHSQFRQIIAGVDARLERRPAQVQWRDISAAF